jgi:hypothetical protein
MPYGYTGKILQVDLSNQKIEVEEKDEAFYRSYLGGRGIGYHYLMQDVPVQTDPFSPENILVLATGVMTGAPLPAACRFAAVGKSPLTGTAGESEAAGFFGPELKMAGFDAVVFKGRAEKPVYLWVTESKAQIKDAAHLAELGAREVEDAIRDEMGSKKIRVAQTGLAGMNRVRFANITNNLGHFNGRGGFGALMGSKNIRAVAALGSMIRSFCVKPLNILRPPLKIILQGKRCVFMAPPHLRRFYPLPEPCRWIISGAASWMTPLRSAGIRIMRFFFKKEKAVTPVPSAAKGALPWMIPSMAWTPVMAGRSMRPLLRWVPTSILRILKPLQKAMRSVIAIAWTRFQPA